MAPSFVLTELAPSSDTPAPTKFTPGVARPFTFTTTLPALSTAPSTPPAEQCSASARPSHRTFAGQWTGTPIRATVPLPRRTRAAHSIHHASPRRTALPARTPAPASRRMLPRDDGADSMDEDDQEGVVPFVFTYDSESDSEGEFVVAPARCYKYESITAVDGLDVWSFEVRLPVSWRVRGLTQAHRNCASSAMLSPSSPGGPSPRLLLSPPSLSHRHSSLVWSRGIRSRSKISGCYI